MYGGKGDKVNIIGKEHLLGGVGEIGDAAGETWFLFADANKNVRKLYTAAGEEAANYDYTPFGAVFASSGSAAGANVFRFSSEYHDPETALVYYNYRYYSPVLGRFLTRDPIAESGGLNLYAITNNMLIDHIDYLGLSEIILIYDNFDPMFKRWALNTYNKIKNGESTIFGNIVKYDLLKDHIYLIPYTSTKALLGAGDRKKCISYLATFGHGGRGMIWFNIGNWNYNKDSEENKVVFTCAYGIPGAKLSGKTPGLVMSLDVFKDFNFADQAVFELYHCKTGRQYELHGFAKNSVLDYLRNLLPNIKVFGYDGGINNDDGRPYKK